MSAEIPKNLLQTNSTMAPPGEENMEEKMRELKVGDEDPERKMKKEQKAKLKEEKKLKAAQKAEAAKLQAKKANDGAKTVERKNRKRDSEEENPQDFVDPLTPAGAKKHLSSQMARQYNPSAVEKAWYAWWEASGFFIADAKNSKPPFVIMNYT